MSQLQCGTVLCLAPRRRWFSGIVSLAAAFFALHWPFMRLPYFWDEAAQFVPAARDILRGAGWIPSSAAPNIHPPGVVAYLALSWRLAGESPFVTRSAMLLLAAFGILSAFLLARELCRKVPGHPEFLAAALLCLSPLFFAQSMLAGSRGLRRPGAGEGNRAGGAAGVLPLAGRAPPLARGRLVRRAGRGSRIVDRLARRPHRPLDRQSRISTL